MSKLSLPRIYNSSVPEQLKKFLKTDKKVAVVYAPTGSGKTVACSRIIADTIKLLRKSGQSCTGSVLMPYRVSVKEMFSYLNQLKTAFNEDHVYGYGISGDTQRSEQDHVVLQTVGYFLEGFIASLTANADQLKVIMLDEAHDVSWQTDFVLSLLMWRIKLGDNIKLIISSATLDVQKIEKQYGIETVNMIMEQEKKHHIVSFNNISSYYPLDGQKVSKNFYDVMLKGVVAAYKTTKTGHILVLMPGQEEIIKLIENLKRCRDFDENAMFISLYSQLSKDDIQFAIDTPEDKDTRKIIVATNIVENAITINDLVAVVDSCLRKELFVDQDGINELRLTVASQSNIIQAYGRCGRQGSDGYAFITISQNMFESLPQFSRNEIERNPLYPQLIKIFRHGLPHSELLSHVSSSKLCNDIAYLEKHEMITKTENGDVYNLTKTGDIISQLPSGIKVGKFIVKSIDYIEQIATIEKFGIQKAKNIRGNFYYYVCLTAAWIERGGSIFEIVNQRPRESPEAFELRKEQTEDKQSEFYGSDCFQTFFNVWFSSFKTRENLQDWCRNNKIFYKALVEIDRSSKDIANALSNILRQKIPILTEIHDFTPTIGSSLQQMMIETMKTAFSEAVFSYGGAPKRLGQKAEYIPVSFRGGFMAKFIIDRAVKSDVAHGEPETSCVLALNIRRKENMYFLSSIVCIQHSMN